MEPPCLLASRGPLGIEFPMHDIDPYVLLIPYHLYLHVACGRLAGLLCRYWVISPRRKSGTMPSLSPSLLYMLLCMSLSAGCFANGDIFTLKIIGGCLQALACNDHFLSTDSAGRALLTADAVSIASR